MQCAMKRGNTVLFSAEPRTRQVRQPINSRALTDWSAAFGSDLPKAVQLAPLIAPMLNALGYRANSTADVEDRYNGLEARYEVLNFS